MISSPLLGVLLHAIGGFAAGSFYAPLKKVERWGWESSWLVMGLAAWMVAPWGVAWIDPQSVVRLGIESHTGVDVVRVVRFVMGCGKSHVWSLRPLSRHGARIRSRARVLHDLWNADATAGVWPIR